MGRWYCSDRAWRSFYFSIPLLGISGLDVLTVCSSHFGPNPPERATGRAALPGTSDVDFLGDLKRVVDLNAQVAYGAFDPMARWP